VLAVNIVVSRANQGSVDIRADSKCTEKREGATNPGDDLGNEIISRSMLLT